MELGMVPMRDTPHDNALKLLKDFVELFWLLRSFACEVDKVMVISISII